MNLSRRYQPNTLDEIVGQPAVVRWLKTFAVEPYPCCIAFVGSPGVGKSATAKVLIQELTANPISVHSYAGPDVTIDEGDMRHVVVRLDGGPVLRTPYAAAPELLKALYRAVDACEAHNNGEAMDYDWVGEAQAAIAKAVREETHDDE